VDPRGVAVDARGVVARLHRIDGRRTLGWTEIAVKQRVVVNGAFGVAREHRRGNAIQPLECGAEGTADVLLP
jgi:hypothetical protein